MKPKHQRFAVSAILLMLFFGLRYWTDLQARARIPTLSILALGDSYTIGQGGGPEARWPVQLAGMLRDESLNVSEPEILARTGWTTSDLLKALDQDPPQPSYGLVCLLIGVNNQYQGQSLTSYRQELNRLLTRAITLAGQQPARVLVLSIPDWGVTPFAAGRDAKAIAAEIDAFNLIKSELSTSRGVNYLDITSLSRQVRQQPALLAEDGLHYSGEMYRRWAEAARQRLLVVLPETSDQSQP